MIDAFFDLTRTLSRFGADEASLLVVGEATAWGPRERLEYADLLPRARREPALPVEAIVEADGRPLIYVVRRNEVRIDVGWEDAVLRLRRRLACRGTPAYVAVVDVGRLEVHACTFGAPQAPVLNRGVDDADALASVRDLADGACHQGPPIMDADDPSEPRNKRKPRTRRGAVQGGDVKSVHDVLLESINNVAEALSNSPALLGCEAEGDLVLSLVGRCLMSRFLIDRGILTESTFPELWAVIGTRAPRACFDTAQTAAITSRWLDRTFNGELLPLGVAPREYEGLLQSFEAQDAGFFQILGSLLYQVDARGQLSLPLWDEVDFAHVQVGLLSEVYEDFAHRRSAEEARRASVHFTPRHIAELVVSQAFGALDTAMDEARVLDPAAGAGVFLAVAFRRLYLARWERCIAEGASRPGTAEIRSILYGQIRGYDIDSGALTLAALSLYLVAIEIDPDPIPPQKLTFARPLLGTVLVDVGQPSPGCDVVLGSIGDEVPREDWGAFDVIVGNPPWTSWTGRAGKEIETLGPAIMSRVMARRRGQVPGSDLIAPQNPDQVPDLPLVWRSMEWARPGGIIGLVLHARLLFKTQPAAIAARAALFRNVRVTGIINGAALRREDGIWPRITAQFCILFAYNSVPRPTDEFNYVSPFLETHYNRRGIIRIDPSRTLAISVAELEDEPTLLKTLFRGDVLDTSIVAKLRRGKWANGLEGTREPDYSDTGSALRTFRHEEEVGFSDAREQSSLLSMAPIGAEMKRLGSYLKRLGLQGREGFQIGKPERRTCDARAVRDLNGRILDGREKLGLLLDPERLPPFDYDMLQYPRSPNIYGPPLLLVREAAKVDEGELTASIHLGKTPVIYSEAYTGYRFEPASVSKGTILYIACVINSRAFRYFMLMTSSKYGVERDAWSRAERDQFPILPFDMLDAELRRRFDEEAEALAAGRAPDEDWLMDCVRRAYGLDEVDHAIMDDTLSIAQPTAKCRDLAQSRPTPDLMRAYARRLEDVIRPLLKLIDVDVVVRVRGSLLGMTASWCFVDVEVAGHEIREANVGHLAALIADEEGCSVIYDQSHPPSIRIGLLAQRRFWLASRATLAATVVIDMIEGARKAARVR